MDRYFEAAAPAHTCVLTDLRLFKAGDSHKDVVKVSAAPPQHVHALLTPFLPKLIDGILCAGERSRQGTKNHTTVHQLPGTLLTCTSWVYNPILLPARVLLSSLTLHEACGEEEEPETP